MARIRSIKPEFATSSQVVACCRDARLLFILLWPFCDDGGVHPADPLRTKMECFPGDAEVGAEDVERWAGELLGQGLLSRFEAEGRRWWKVTGWAKHQRVDRPSFKYPQSGAPAMDDSPNARRTPGEDSAPEGKGKEGNGGSSLAPLGTPPPDGGSPAADSGADPSLRSGQAPSLGLGAGAPRPTQGAPSRQPGIVSTWNALAGSIGCAQVNTVSKTRLRKLKVRLGEKAFHWPAILHAAREAKGAHGKAWFTFDFLIENDTNYLKLLEGKYREAIGPPANGRGAVPIVHAPAEHPGDFQ